MSEKDNQSLEAQMAELDALVAWFESDDFTIEKAMSVYEKADALAKNIETHLSELKNEVTVLKKKFDQAT